MVMMGLLLESTIVLLKPSHMLFTTVSDAGLDVNLDLDHNLIVGKKIILIWNQFKSKTVFKNSN